LGYYHRFFCTHKTT